MRYLKNQFRGRIGEMIDFSKKTPKFVYVLFF